MTDLLKNSDLVSVIADAIAEQVKSYNVPAVCVRLGLQETASEDDKAEANNSKRSYVKKRLADVPLEELHRLASIVYKECPTDSLADAVSEIRFGDQRVTELVRRDVLKVLNRVDDIFGERSAFDVLSRIFGKSVTEDSFGVPIRDSLKARITQHFLRNSDWSAEELFINCGALTCSQARFFKLLEEVLHPTTRRDAEQASLAERIGQALARSGFTTIVTGADSGYPIYGVARIQDGVAGAMKNLIFASVGEKPELVFKDALNNDVEIVKHADSVLIYDIPLPPSGSLQWKNLRDWWVKSRGVTVVEAKEQLFQRLRQSVRLTESPGEYALFHTYYKQYGPRLGDGLPALIPQVYLHYDPYTQRQRGDEKFLPRQRMDFLLMLEHGVRIVIEIDGKHHYSRPDNIADPVRYAEMASEDRRLRLQGYEVYRFGGGEFKDVDMHTWKVGHASEALAIEFFDRLLRKHRIIS